MNSEKRADNDEEKQFRELYRKSLCISEYLSIEERRFVEENMGKYSAIVEKEQQIQKNASSLRRNAVASTGLDVTQGAIHTIKDQFSIQYIPPMDTCEGSYRLSPTLLFQGSLVHGKPCGNGDIIDISKNELVYRGSVLDGLYHGAGVAYRNNHVYEEGEFVKGCIVSGKRYTPEGILYVGHFSQNMYNGEGRLVFPCGFFIAGTFTEGKPTVVQVSYPTSRRLLPVEISPASFQLTHQGVYIVIHSPLFFYFNGDIFVGTLSPLYQPLHGVLYQFRGTSFTPMIVGKGTNVTTKPTIVVESNSYKYLSFDSLDSL